MTAQHSVCRLCFDTVEENSVEAIHESLRGMLQTVLTGIDLTISENPAICIKCHTKLEANYNFKKKCIFTEDSITPHITENVKIDLKEIRNEIIKSENVEDDKNVCRLCLQFVDNDMTLSDTEKQQFRQFFPEINLSHTNFVVLCSTCYDHLHKYFIFVTSCWTLEQQLCNYSLNKMGSEIDIVDECVNVKLEGFQEFIKNVKAEDTKDAVLSEEDKKEVVLNEELDIKCDTDEDDERCDRNNQEIERSLISLKEETNSDIFSDDSVNDQIADANPSKITMYHCEQCEKKFKHNKSLKSHVWLIHTDPSKITWYQCEQCDKKFYLKHKLKTHVSVVHTDPSKITWRQCEQCDKKFKHKWYLKTHTMQVHTDVSRINWHQCEFCDRKFKLKKRLTEHVLNIHRDPSEITWYHCGQCNKKFRHNYNLKSHVLRVHTDPSKISWYQCDSCDKKFKLKSQLTWHILNIHTDPSEISWHQCEQCDKKFKQIRNLKVHVLLKHTDK